MGSAVKHRPDATYWVDWQFTPDEWRRFDELERRHTWRLAAQQVGVCLAVSSWGCLILAFWGVSHRSNPESLSIVLWLSAWSYTLGLLFGLWRVWREHSFGQTLQMKRHQGPRIVRINPDTIQIGAMKIPLIRDYDPRKLVSVTVRSSQPAVLQFATSFAKRSLLARRYQLWVPVPAGHEVEAAALAERFRREVIGKDRVYGGTPTR